jgi:hypothetical protein
MTKEIKGTRELWDLFQRDPLGLYVQAAAEMKEAGINEIPSLTRALEHVSPTQADDKSGLDTFERLMLEAEIITRSDPRAGYWASPASKFVETPATRALYTEFCARKWREVSHGYIGPQQRATLLNSDGIVGSWERPFYDSTQILPSQRIQPAIPLSELVAMTTGINSDAYRSFYMTYDAEKLRKYRVGETAEIPIATIVGAEHTIRLFKYGRGIAISYEAMRRMRVDKLAFYIQWMAIQTEIDKVSAALAILIAGDGNSNTAATSYNMTTLDTAATAGTLTLKAWLAFKMKFVQPYVLTTALMQDVVALQVALLNTGTANIPLVASALGQLGAQVTPINQFADSVRYGWTSDAPALKIVGFDKRFALERVTEIGSEISEMERVVTNQTQELVMSEVEGYALLDGNATRILDINA